MVLDDLLCAIFPRCARKNRTPYKVKNRSAEGENTVLAAYRQLCKSYYSKKGLDIRNNMEYYHFDVNVKVVQAL
jgi:hypothetical protein